MSAGRRYAIIIPACNEEACIGEVIGELRGKLDGEIFTIVVGVNGSVDQTVERALGAGALVAETKERGYGHGCAVAVALAQREFPALNGYIFCSADGASDPVDVMRLVGLHRKGVELVLGQRVGSDTRRSAMRQPRNVSNLILGAWCGVLTGRFFCDLGPLRLIGSDLYRRVEMREFNYGWTIEAQVMAVRMGVGIETTRVGERKRLAGEQKVSGVSLGHSLRVGREIFAAGWRTRWRKLPL